MTAERLAAAAGGRLCGGDCRAHLGGLRRAGLRLRRWPPPVQLRRAPRALPGTHSSVRSAAPPLPQRSPGSFGKSCGWNRCRNVQHGCWARRPRGVLSAAAGLWKRFSVEGRWRVCRGAPGRGTGNLQVLLASAERPAASVEEVPRLASSSWHRGWAVTPWCGCARRTGAAQPRVRGAGHGDALDGLVRCAPPSLPLSFPNQSQQPVHPPSMAVPRNRVAPRIIAPPCGVAC
jgi:hypothetical protein